MHRIIFTIGPFSLYSYGLLMAIAFITALYITTRIAINNKIDKDRVIDMATWIILGAILGARLWFVIENFHFFRNDLMGILRIWEGGMVFYGGFIGGFISGIYYIKRNKLNVFLMADIIAPGLAMGIAIGRIGCFLNGCCYGKICSSFGIQFPAKDYPPAYYQQLRDGLIDRTATHSLPVIPTQNIASIIALVIFGVLLYLLRRKLRNGIVFAIFLILYGMDRFAIDFLRYYSSDAMKIGIISYSQITSLIMVIIGIVCSFLIYRKNKQESS